MSEGDSRLDEIPLLPAGVYEATWMANDFAHPDPLPMGRTLTLELKANQVTTLELRSSLTSGIVTYR